MSHKKDHPNSSKDSLSSEQGSEEVVSVDASADLDVLDSDVESVGEKVSEIAKENVSDKSKACQSKGQHVATNQKKTDSILDERLLLREKLLASAPKPSVMRRQVSAVLFRKKKKVERSIGRLNREREYELLSRAISELRQLVHQIDLVAHSSYALLQEIWLKVVHKFA